MNFLKSLGWRRGFSCFCAQEKFVYMSKIPQTAFLDLKIGCEYELGVFAFVCWCDISSRLFRALAGSGAALNFHQRRGLEPQDRVTRVTRVRGMVC